MNFARAACLSEDRYCLATAQGVFLFSLSSPTVERLSETNGLPSNDATALAWLGGTLYIGLDGYLAAWQPAQAQARILASSRRKEKLTPFDDATPFYLRWMTTEGPRLVFAVSQSVTNGLWSFDPSRQQFSLMQPLRLVEVPTLWAGREPDGRVLFATESGLLAYDLARQRPEPIYVTNPPFYLVPELAGSAHPLGFDGLKGFGTPHCRLDGWLWFSAPFRRHSPDWAQQELLPSLRPPYYFSPSECLQVLPGGRQALLGDQLGLWLVDFNPAAALEAKAPAPSSH